MTKTAGAILLAGGLSSRMGHAISKPFLPLGRLRVIEWSLCWLLDHPLVDEVIVVCASEYQKFLNTYPVRFALPGQERALSVQQGLHLVTSPWVCIHDAARPFVPRTCIDQVFEVATAQGAAALALPMRNTVRHVKGNQTRCLDRTSLWEMQTPQVIQTAWLRQAFASIDPVTCTDDLALIEAIGRPVHLVMGSPKNFKITVPADYEIATALASQIENSYGTL